LLNIKETNILGEVLKLKKRKDNIPEFILKKERETKIQRMKGVKMMKEVFDSCPKLQDIVV